MEAVVEIEFEVDLDDDLLAHAKSITGLTDTSEVFHAALTALVQREATRGLDIHRRRVDL